MKFVIASAVFLLTVVGHAEVKIAPAISCKSEFKELLRASMAIGTYNEWIAQFDGRLAGSPPAAEAIQTRNTIVKERADLLSAAQKLAKNFESECIK